MLFYPPLRRRERSFSSVVLIPGVGRECRKVATSIVVGKVLVDSLGLDFSDGEMLGWIIGWHGV